MHRRVLASDRFREFFLQIESVEGDLVDQGASDLALDGMIHRLGRLPESYEPSGVPVKRDPYVEFTRRFFSRWAGTYDLLAASIAFAYRAAVRAIAPAAGQRVLDLCTGTGEVGSRAARRGARVIGVDLTLEMLLRAAHKARDLSFAPCLMDARHLAFGPDTFDTVCLSLALHDMPPRVRLEVLAEARRVGRSRIVVLDYDLPRRRWLHRLVAWLIGLLETPYFESFVRQRPEELLAAAGLRGVRRTRLLPGLIALFTVDLTEEVSPP